MLTLLLCGALAQNAVQHMLGSLQSGRDGSERLRLCKAERARATPLRSIPTETWRLRCLFTAEHLAAASDAEDPKTQS